MKLKEALELGLTCNLETVGECIYNVKLHAISLFSYTALNKELDELYREESELYERTHFNRDSNINVILEKGL
ncbi:MAG: hypothetical protein IJZ36_05240 [Bacilli bacterium]|nr:hypothetical protein [Bacilli bacterium]